MCYWDKHSLKLWQHSMLMWYGFAFTHRLSLAWVPYYDAQSDYPPYTRQASSIQMALPANQILWRNSWPSQQLGVHHTIICNLIIKKLCHSDNHFFSKHWKLWEACCFMRHKSSTIGTPYHSVQWQASCFALPCRPLLHTCSTVILSGGCTERAWEWKTWSCPTKILTQLLKSMQMRMRT